MRDILAEAARGFQLKESLIAWCVLIVWAVVLLSVGIGAMLLLSRAQSRASSASPELPKGDPIKVLPARDMPVTIERYDALRVGVFLGASKKRRVETGDSSIAAIHGDEVEALAVLDASTRAHLCDLPDRLELPLDQIPARLEANAANDPLGAVRARNLEVLLSRFPTSAEAERARAAALAGNDPDRLLVIARESGADGAQLLRSIVDLKDAREQTVVAALGELAKNTPMYHFALFIRMLGSPSASIQLAAVEALSAVPLRFIPMILVLDKIDVLSPRALEAALALLMRALEDTKSVDADTQQRIRRVLVAKDASGRFAQGGALTVVEGASERGALSFSRTGGEGALSATDEE